MSKRSVPFLAPYQFSPLSDIFSRLPKTTNLPEILFVKFIKKEIFEGKARSFLPILIVMHCFLDLILRSLTKT